MAGPGPRVDVVDIFKRLLQTNNQAQFTAKFTGQNREVLPFVFEMDKFVKVNGLTDPGIKFRRIFNTLESHYQNLFIEDQAADATFTVELLKTWLIKKFPPPPMKHEWLYKLKSIKMRKNEDPKLVYDEFSTILRRVDAAIKYVNKNRSDRGRVRRVTDEQILDALTAIFIRNNNVSKLGNDGIINQKVVQFIYRKNPTTYEHWKNIFKDIQSQLIPDCFKSLREYQYTTYPSNPSDYDVYKKPSKPEENKSNSKVTKRESGNKRKRKQTFKGGNKRRKYIQYCRRCGRDNHPESECHANHDVFGKPIGKPSHGNNNTNNYQNKKKYCKRCKRNNHYTNECNASFYPDHTPIRDNKFQQRRRNDYNNKNNRNDKEFHTTKPNNKTSAKDLMALLTQKISNNKNLDEGQQFECMSLLNNLQNNMSARQDE